MFLRIVYRERQPRMNRRSSYFSLPRITAVHFFIHRLFSVRNHSLLMSFTIVNHCIPSFTDFVSIDLVRAMDSSPGIHSKQYSPRDWSLPGLQSCRTLQLQLLRWSSERYAVSHPLSQSKTLSALHSVEDLIGDHLPAKNNLISDASKHERNNLQIFAFFSSKTDVFS